MSEQLQDIKAEGEPLLEMAWVVIANAGWDGMSPSPGWQDAAERWRDAYFKTLPASIGDGP